jgi:hypothetical protein
LLLHGPRELLRGDVAALEEDVSELLHVRLIGAIGLMLDLVAAGE